MKIQSLASAAAAPTLRTAGLLAEVLRGAPQAIPLGRIIAARRMEAGR